MIMSSELHAGEALPAVYALEKSIHVSIITVQTAYDDLQHEGFIDTTGVCGFFCYHKKTPLCLACARTALIDTHDSAVA